MSPITRRRAKQTKPGPSRLAAKQEKRLQRRSNKPPSPSEESQEEESHESGIEESDSGDEFEVETILDKKMKNGEVHYRVKWRGFDMRYATWEPVENLEGAPAKIEAFEKTRKLEEAKAKEERQIETSKEKKASLLGKRELPNTRSNRRSRYAEEIEDEENSEDEEDEEEEQVQKRVLRSRNQSVKTRQSNRREEKVKGKGGNEKGRSGGRNLRARNKRTMDYDESESQQSEDEEEEDEDEDQEEEEEEEQESEGDEIESPGKIKSVEREKMQEETLYGNTPEKAAAKEASDKQNGQAPKIVVVPEKTTVQPQSEQEAKKADATKETGKEAKPATTETPQDKTLTVESEKPSLAKSPTSSASKTTLYPQENSAFQSSKLVAPKEGLIPTSQPLKPVTPAATLGELPKPVTAEKLASPYLLTSPVMNPLLAANNMNNMNNMNYLNNQTMVDDMALKNFITFQGSLQISNYLFPPNRMPNFLAPQAPNLLLGNNQALLNSLALQAGLPGAALLQGALSNSFNPLASYQMNPLAGLSAMGNLGLPLASMDLLAKLQGAQNPLGMDGAHLDQILGMNMNMNHRLNMMNLQQNLQSIEKKGNSNNDGKKDGLSQIGLSRQASGANDAKKNALTTPSQSDKISSQGAKGSSSAGNDGAAKP